MTLHSIREVLGLEDRSSHDLLLVLRHAFHIDMNGERHTYIDDRHKDLGQVVNHQLLLSFKSHDERARFINEPMKGTPDHQLTSVTIVFGDVYAAERMQAVRKLLDELSSVVAFQVSHLPALLDRCVRSLSSHARSQSTRHPLRTGRRARARGDRHARATARQARVSHQEH